MQFLKRLKINYLIEALVMIAVGVVLIVWTGDSIRFFARLGAGRRCGRGGIFQK